MINSIIPIPNTPHGLCYSYFPRVYRNYKDVDEHLLSKEPIEPLISVLGCTGQDHLLIYLLNLGVEYNLDPVENAFELKYINKIKNKLDL
jgi:hypothetical protein